MSEPLEAAFLETFARAKRQREFETAVKTGLAKIGMPEIMFSALMTLAPQVGSIEKAGVQLNIDPALIAALLAAFAQFGPMLLKLLGL